MFTRFIDKIKLLVVAYECKNIIGIVWWYTVADPGGGGGLGGLNPPPWAAKKKKNINVHRKTPS